MLRSLLLILMSALLFAPSTAAALERCDEEQAVEWTMSERFSHGGSDSLLCPELVELVVADERIRKLLSDFFSTDSGYQFISDAPRQAARSRSGSCDDVVQCFRVAGVRLLTFGTAPPRVNNED